MKELSEEEVLDSGYGCAVANRFILDDESDPFDLLYQAQVQTDKRKKKEEPKKPSSSSKPNNNKKESQRDRKALIRTDTTSNKPTPGPTRPVRPQPEERTEKRVAFSETRFNEGDSLGYSIERPVEMLNRDFRGRGGGRGRGGRGFGNPRSNDGFDPRGKREFERHSGSDRASVRPEEKRGGNGPRNWGSMKDQVSSAVADAAPAEEPEGEEAAETPETDLENGPLESEEVLEVALEMTLDEWKALQEQSRPKAEFNIRKAETKLPPKAVVIHKSKRNEKRGHDVEEDLIFRRPANDITCQVDINFGSLGRPSRGARGGRGGRGRGAATTPRAPQNYSDVVAPNPDDPEDFPALA